MTLEDYMITKYLEHTAQTCISCGRFIIRKKGSNHKCNSCKDKVNKKIVDSYLQYVYPQEKKIAKKKKMV